MTEGAASPRPPIARTSAAPWPAGAVFGPDGLTIAGISAAILSERFGTPLMVVDEDDLRARFGAAAGIADRVLFAVKAFTAHPVIRIALESGLDLLAASGGEVEACLRAGAPAGRIVLHGNNKSDAELALAVEAGLGLLVADGPDELVRLDAAARAQGRVQAVLLRVIPDVAVRTHEAIATGHEASKFGTPLGEAVDAVRACGDLPALRFEGLQAHIGSQVQQAESYVQAVDTLVDLAARVRAEAGTEVRTIDVGGGYAVTYVDEAELVPAEIAHLVATRLHERCAQRGIPVPALVLEPGRSLVANPVLTLYRVGGTKRAGGRALVAVDGGMSDNLRPMLYDARFSVAAAGPSTAGPSAHVTVVGKHCESGDVLAEDVALPADLAPGDLLAVAATGAYTYGLANAYNRVGRPAVVAVRAGHATPWLRREDAADMDRLELATPRRDPEEVELPAGITVRAARASDAQPFLDFWTAVVAEGRYVRSERVAHPARVYRRRFRKPWSDREAQIVAVEDDRVVGHLFIQRESHPVTRHVATLGIAVAADRRGQGVGTALMAEAVRWARGAGVQKLVLSVYPHNTGAIALYRKFGFVEEGRLSRQSHKSYGYEDELLMGAWIGPEDA